MAHKVQQKYKSQHTSPASENDDIVSVERVPLRPKESMPRPQPSMAPGGEDFMMAAAMGAEWATSIRDSWRCSLPVVTVDQAEWDRLVARTICF